MHVHLLQIVSCVITNLILIVFYFILMVQIHEKPGDESYENTEECLQDTGKLIPIQFFLVL